jgi:hypothetical protein
MCSQLMSCNRLKSSVYVPIKEEFYTPTIFVEKSDLRGRHLHIVGQVDKCLVLFSCILCEVTINGRIFLDFNLIDLIESLQIKVSLVKRSKLPVHKEFRPSRIGHAPLLDCKGSQFKSSPSNFRSKTRYLSNLQTSPLIFVDNSD